MSHKVAMGIPVLLIAGLIAYGAYANSLARKAATAICEVAKTSQSARMVKTLVASSYPEVRISDYTGKVVFTAGGIGMYRAYCKLEVDQDTVKATSVDFVFE